MNTNNSIPGTLNNIDYLNTNNMEHIINPINKSPYIARPKTKLLTPGLSAGKVENPLKGKVFIAYPKSKVPPPTNETVSSAKSTESKDALFIAYPKQKTSLPGVKDVLDNRFLNVTREAYVAMPEKMQSRIGKLYINTKGALQRKKICISNLFQTLRLKVS